MEVEPDGGFWGLLLGSHVVGHHHELVTMDPNCVSLQHLSYLLDLDSNTLVDIPVLLPVD